MLDCPELGYIGDVRINADDKIGACFEHTKAVITIAGTDIEYRSPRQWSNRLLQAGPLHVGAPLAIHIDAEKSEGTLPPRVKFAEL